MGRRRFLGQAALTVAGTAAGALAAGHIAPERPAEASDIDMRPRPAADSSPGAARPPALTIIAYHSIPSRAAFAEDMDWLQAWNYSCVTPDQVADHLSGGPALPPKPLLLTFDDGYKSQWDNAWPELRDRGMLATMYVCTGWVDGKLSVEQGQFMESHPITWAQLRTMAAHGQVSVQSHTVSHHRQTDLSPAQVHSEFTRSQARIEAMVPGQTVAHFAYPFGAWNLAARQTLADAGCRTARTMTVPGPGYGFFAFADASSDPLALPCAGGSFHDIVAANYFHTVTAGDELCPDFGFEAGGKGWQLGPGFQISQAVVHTGRRSLQARAQGRPSESVSALPIPVVEQTTAQGSVALLALDLPSAARVELVFEILARDSRTVLASPTVASVSSDHPGWAELDWTLALPAGAAYIRPLCRLEPSGAWTGSGYWDDLSIRATTPDPHLSR